MIIENIRLGFACNSSSTHSLIFNAVPGDDDGDVDQQYGCDEWCASLPDSKLAYLAQTLSKNMSHIVGREITKSICREWLSCDFNEDGYIDQQSVMRLPVDRKYGLPDKDFFVEFRDYLLRPNIGIVGGSDNNFYERFVNRHDFPLPRETNDIFWAKKDGKWWILFNPKTGAKITLSFEDGAGKYEKANTPELCDIKCTDRCYYNCTYCYQGSTQHGKHAETDVFYTIAQKLAEMQVFEVALGGGEPTLHPDFAKILYIFHYAGIVPNFTTATTKWIKNTEILEAVKKCCGRFAVSLREGMQISSVASEMKDAGFYDKSWDKYTFNIHLVMGTFDEWQLRNVLDSKVPVTLLGYKNVGFGPNFKPKPTNKVLEFLAKYDGWTSISIDTAFAEQHKEWLSGITSSKFLRYRDGTHSMYIDAVAGKMGPSSYTEEGLVSVDNWHNADIIGEFAKWR